MTASTGKDNALGYTLPDKVMRITMDKLRIVLDRIYNNVPPEIEPENIGVDGTNVLPQ